MEKFRVIVAGGRDFQNYEVLEQSLDHVLSKKSKTHTIVIVSGEANGADSLGEDYAEKRNFEIDSHPADWDTHGKKAGFLRNAQMADHADACVVFWDGVSKGSKHMINLATKKGLLLRVFDYEGNVIRV